MSIIPCSGWLNLKTWFFPKITRDPVFRMTGLSILRPFTKHIAPGYNIRKHISFECDDSKSHYLVIMIWGLLKQPTCGINFTSPSEFSKMQCSLSMWDPTSWTSCKARKKCKLELIYCNQREQTFISDYHRKM